MEILTTKLSDYNSNIYSQSGEDGVIKKIFEIMGTKSKVCVEFGASDGFYCSNTANLWRNGWTAVLIESDKDKYNSLIKNVEGYDCFCVNVCVKSKGSNSIDCILSELEFDVIDLMSIDIDGNDYYIFDGLKIRPRVVICEYNPTIPHHIDLCAVEGKDNFFGCSALSLVKSAEKKGYRLIAVTESCCFFVNELEYSKFEEYDKDLESIFPIVNLVYYITGYNGNFILSKKPSYGCSPCTRPYRKKLIGEYFIFPHRLPVFFRYIKQILIKLKFKK